MFYVLTKPGEEPVYPYTLTDLMRANPSTSFPRDMTGFDASDWYCYPVQDTTPPEAIGMVAQRIMAELVDGVWHERWELVDAPAAPVPDLVSMRQARLGLLNAGLLDDVEAAIITMDEPGRTATQIEWEYSTEVSRTSPTTAMLAGVLGLTEDQIDELFRQAAGL